MKNSFFSHFAWRLFERCGAQLVSLVVTIVLARILDPKTYGTVAIVTVIITFLQVLVDSGLGTSLIQKKDSDDVDFSSVFYFKIVFCVLLYLLLFFLAPLIANFYNSDILIPVIRVLGVLIIVGGLKNIEQAYVSKHMLFRCFFFSTIIGTIISAAVGIAMALKGFGIWALVAQMLTNEVIDTTILWFTVKWRPKKLFSIKRIRTLFSFGWKIMAASLLENIYDSLSSLIVGKKYSSEDLAYYNKGKQFPHLVIANLSMSLDSVLLPTLSAVQDNLPKVKELVRRSVKITSFALLPITFGMAVCSEPFVATILGDKWMSTVPFLRIMCFSYSFYAVNSAFKNGIKAIGRSNVFLITEIIKKAIGISLILIFMRHSVEAIAFGLLISSFANIIVNAFPYKKFLDYSVLEQLKDFCPSLIASATMFLCIYPLNLLIVPYWTKLLIIIPVGAFLYILIGFLFKMTGFLYFEQIICNFFAKGRKEKCEK